MTLYTNMPFTQAAPIWLFPGKRHSHQHQNTSKLCNVSHRQWSLTHMLRHHISNLLVMLQLHLLIMFEKFTDLYRIFTSIDCMCERGYWL